MLPQFKRVADGELTMFNQNPSAHKDKEANWRRAEGAVLNGHAPVLADGRSAPRQMDRKALDGSKTTYKIHLPPNIPPKDFCSFVVYDTRPGLCYRPLNSSPGGL